MIRGVENVFYCGLEIYMFGNGNFALMADVDKYVDGNWWIDNLPE